MKVNIAKAKMQTPFLLLPSLVRAAHGNPQKPLLDKLLSQISQPSSTHLPYLIKCSADSDYSFRLLEIIPDIVLGTNIWTAIIHKMNDV